MTLRQREPAYHAKIIPLLQRLLIENGKCDAFEHFYLRIPTEEGYQQRVGVVVVSRLGELRTIISHTFCVTDQFEPKYGLHMALSRLYRREYPVLNAWAIRPELKMLFDLTEASPEHKQRVEAILAYEKNQKAFESVHNKLFGN